MIVIKDLQKVHGQDLFAAFVEVVSGRTDVSHVELNLGIKDPLVPETTTVRKVVGLYISEEVWEKVIKPTLTAALSNNNPNPRPGKLILPS